MMKNAWEIEDKLIQKPGRKTGEETGIIFLKIMIVVWLQLVPLNQTPCGSGF
jgi:hypothetical protein